MKIPILRMIALASALFLASGAHGGASVDTPVDVDLVGLTASGSQLSAKTSKNDNEFIGCGMRLFDNGQGNTFTFAFCQAEDAEGESVACFTFNEALIDTIASATAYSFITFSWSEDDPSMLQCTRIGFSTQSIYLPDKKIK